MAAVRGRRAWPLFVAAVRSRCVRAFINAVRSREQPSHKAFYIPARRRRLSESCATSERYAESPMGIRLIFPQERMIFGREL